MIKSIEDEMDDDSQPTLDQVQAHIGSDQPDLFYAVQALTKINYQLHDEINVLREEVAAVKKPAEVQYRGDPPRLQSAFEFLIANFGRQDDNSLELLLVFEKNGVEMILQFSEYHDGRIYGYWRDHDVKCIPFELHGNPPLHDDGFPGCAEWWDVDHISRQDVSNFENGKYGWVLQRWGYNDTYVVKINTLCWERQPSTDSTETTK